MSKKSGMIFILSGTVLVLSALSLFLWNRLEDERAGEQAEKVLEELEDSIGKEKTLLPAEEEISKPETILVDGYEYIGSLKIPALELELPVMSQWDYKRLKIAPCRESGSAMTDDLVIAAHNYNSHFGRLQYLQPGNQIFFEEVNGTMHTYCVESCQILQPNQTEAVLLSEYDLVLYTCTKGGATRVVIYCSRAEAG